MSTVVRKVARFSHSVFVKPALKFSLGALVGASLTFVLVFFPFPKGKLYAAVVGPIVIAGFYLMERYTKCSIMMPVTLLDMLWRKGPSFLSMLITYFGVYFGSYNIVAGIQVAIDAAPADQKESMTMLPEKLLLKLNESIESRLRTAIVVTAFFYVFRDQLFIRLLLYVLGVIWLMTSPELNPPLAMGWFGQSSKFDETSLAQFWVNMVFIVIACVFFTFAIRAAATIGSYAWNKASTYWQRRQQTAKEKTF